MNKWELIETALVPGSQTQMSLFKNGSDYSICIDGKELMNTRMHGSEDSLAELGCANLVGRQDGCVLVGGLGMGFTAAATLRHVGPKAKVIIAELVPVVEEWNRHVLGAYAGHPLNDPRASVAIGDVADLLRTNRNTYDAILLDVDNGPNGMTQEKNNWLYWPEGLHAISEALRPGGVLAIWSAHRDRAFHRRLHQLGYEATEHRVSARGSKGGGGRHIIWVAIQK